MKPIEPASCGPGGKMSRDSGVMPYLWSDLIARRNAVGLQLDELTAALGIDWFLHTEREDGTREASGHLVDELMEMEGFVAATAAALIASAATGEPGAGEPVVLQAFCDQGAFEKACPEALTIGDGGVPYPMVLHDVAVGRAAAALTRAGYDVEVWRGDRRADLAVRRVAVGLTKNEAGPVLGLATKKYYERENGKRHVSAGLIAEFQAMDDEITKVSEEAAISAVDGISIVPMFDDEADFGEQYPEAQTLRDGYRYPLRMARIAAGRRAGVLEAEGKVVRIVAMTPNPARRSTPGRDDARDVIVGGRGGAKC